MLHEAEGASDVGHAEDFLEELREEVVEALAVGADPALAREILMQLPVRRFRDLFGEFGLTSAGCFEKSDFLEQLGWSSTWSSTWTKEDSDDEVIDVPGGWAPAGHSVPPPPVGGTAATPAAGQRDRGPAAAPTADRCDPRHQAAPPVPGAGAAAVDPGAAGGKSSALFWGIVDLKYDATRPAKQRVKILETGDGTKSKFSHDGAYIEADFRERFKLKAGATSKKYGVVSTDKRLTHDLIVDAGFGHLVPEQLCLPRKWSEDLPDRIISGLAPPRSRAGDAPAGVVVLKLCNRARSAGVLMVRSEELRGVLRSILEPPDGLGDAGHLEGAEEHARHWWGNEAPSFVAEHLCRSTPVLKDGLAFDATLRVSFALKQRQPGLGPAGVAFGASELDVEWLGGYWKLPLSATLAEGGGAGAADVAVPDASLRDVYVSAASSSTGGTRPADPAMLRDVYSELGDSMQELFGGEVPSHEWLVGQYANQPEFAAFLMARLGMSQATKEAPDAADALSAARHTLAAAPGGPMKDCTSSFLARCDGILRLKAAGGRTAEVDVWNQAGHSFSEAVRLMPSNANALFWSGMAELGGGSAEQAVSLLRRALFLDPDFKGAYINLGVAFLRQGLFQRAVEVSREGLRRFPHAPQCNYNLGAAAYQQAVQIYDDEEAEVLDVERVKALLDVAAANLRVARDSPEAQRFQKSTGTAASPWLVEDGRMSEEAEALAGQKSPAPMAVRLPSHVGWLFMHWRT